MNKLGTTVLESFSTEISSVMLDSTGIDKPVDEDVFSYTLCGCVWLSMIKDRCEDTFPFFSMVRRFGLLHAIDQSATFAQKLCSTNSEDISNALQEVTWVCGELRSLFYAWTKRFENDPYGFIALLRFPKRLTIENKNVEDTCINDFIKHAESMFYAYRRSLESDYQTTTDCRLSLRPYKDVAVNGQKTIAGYSEYVVSRVRSALRETFDLEGMFELLDQQDIQFLDPLKVPTGVCADSIQPFSKVGMLICECPGIFPWVDCAFKVREFPLTTEKVKIGKVEHTLYGAVLPIPCNPKKCTLTNKYQFAHVLSVPKGHDEVRIIAEEQVKRQCMADAVVRIWTEDLAIATKGSIQLNDQTSQQERARLASSGAYATIDWHHASDGYSCEVARALFLDYFNVLDRVRAHYLHIRDRFYFNTILLTMGHKLTPAIQSMLFYSICKACLDVYNSLTGQRIPETSIGIYNDDTIVPIQIAEMVLEFGSALGLEPNMKKTFYSQDNLYRESCGAEYFNGVSLSPLYWPRRRIKGVSSKDLLPELTTLIAIQHKIYTYTSAEAGLCKTLETLFPKLTYSHTLHEGVRDLYGPFRTMEKVHAPCKQDSKEWNLTDPVYSRTKHYGLSGTWPEPRLVSQEIKDFAEFLTYASYLEYGPMYDTPLDELLKVSTRRNPKKWYVEEVFTLTPYYDPIE